MYKWLIGIVCWAHVTVHTTTLSVRRPTPEQARAKEDNQMGLMAYFSQMKRFQALYPNEVDSEFRERIKGLENLMDTILGEGFSKTMGGFSESLFSLGDSIGEGSGDIMKSFMATMMGTGGS